MAVGMRFRGNHDFSTDDIITLELDDNHVDKYAIKILVDNKHVAFVVGGCTQVAHYRWSFRSSRLSRSMHRTISIPLTIFKKYIDPV
jgi:hypothetical protein